MPGSVHELSFHACLRQAWKESCEQKYGVRFCVLFVATTIDTATAEEDVEDFHVPEKNLTGFDQVLLLSALCKQVRDEVQAQSKSLTSSS